MPGQALAPPAVFQASWAQVSALSSPGWGMVWKVQTSLPVFTSQARISPGEAGDSSATSPQVKNRSCQMGIAPFHRAGGGIQGEDLAHAGAVKRAIHHDGRVFQLAVAAQVVAPDFMQA